MTKQYLEAAVNAQKREATHHQRRADRLRRWFETHPECKQPVLDVTWSGAVIRDATAPAIDIEARCVAGWWDDVIAMPVEPNHDYDNNFYESPGDWRQSFKDHPHTKDFATDIILYGVERSVSEQEYAGRQYERVG